MRIKELGFRRFIEEMTATNKPKPKLLISFFCLFACCLQSCDLFEPVSKKEELPPATQEGRNTFGCLVNGKLSLPKGNNGTSNLDAGYAPMYANGLFDLDAYRISDKQDNNIYIYMSDLNKTGTFDLCCLDIGTALFDYSASCYYDRDNSIYRKGELIITRFDLPNQIVSGTFEFTLAKLGCDTLNVTDGRFDVKF